MKKIRNLWKILLITLFLLLPLSSCGSEALSISKLWVRPGITSGNSAIYFELENPTDQDDVLLSAESDVAQSVELHMSKMNEDGTMSMQKQKTVPVPANSTIEFKPGGLHIMLINLVDDLTPGESFELTLNFQKSNSLILEAIVQEP